MAITLIGAHRHHDVAEPIMIVTAHVRTSMIADRAATTGAELQVVIGLQVEAVQVKKS